MFFLIDGAIAIVPIIKKRVRIAFFGLCNRDWYNWVPRGFKTFKFFGWCYRDWGHHLRQKKNIFDPIQVNLNIIL